VLFVSTGSDEMKNWKPYTHTPINVNRMLEFEHATASFGDWLAVRLTKAVGTMTCALFFALLALLGMPGLFQPTVAQWIQWLSQTFIQLVMLSILMVGQQVLNRHQELQAEAQFETVQKMYADLETIIQQNNEILQHGKKVQEN
jgi:hypothetical protein